MKLKYKRKNYFIKKTFQGRFIFQFYLLVIFGALIFSAIFSYVTFDTITVTYENYNLQLDRTPFLLFKQILTTNWIVFIPVGLLVVVAAVFQTHRIAGPLFKIEMVLDEMSRGIITRNLRLRPKDEAQEIITKLNAYNSFLVERLIKLKILSDDIGQNLEKTMQNKDTLLDPDSALVQEIQHDIKTIKNILDEFIIK